MVAHALRSSLIDHARAAALDCAAQAADRLAAGTPASEILAPDEIAAGCELQIIAADGSVSAPEDSGLPAPPHRPTRRRRARHRRSRRHRRQG